MICVPFSTDCYLGWNTSSAIYLYLQMQVRLMVARRRILNITARRRFRYMSNQITRSNYCTVMDTDSKWTVAYSERVTDDFHAVSIFEFVVENAHLSTFGCEHRRSMLDVNINAVVYGTVAA